MKCFAALKARWVLWVWNHTPNCAEMSRLTSLSFEQPMSFRLRCQMWLHHLICIWCQRYTRHLRFLHRAAPTLAVRAEAGAPRELSGETKRRMVERLIEEGTA